MLHVRICLPSWGDVWVWWSSSHSMFTELSWASSVSRSFAAWSSTSKVAPTHRRNIVVFGGLRLCVKCHLLCVTCLCVLS